MAEKKKKILHVLASSKFSGAENVACTIIRNMPDNYEMAYCSPRGPIKKKLNKMHVKYIGLDKLNYKNLRKVVEAYKPDIIHAHDYRASLIAARFSKKYKIISHIHIDNPKVRSLSLWSVLYKKAASRFKKIIWVSEDAFNNFYYKNSGNIMDSSIVLRNIVDVKYTKEKAKEYEVRGSFDLIYLGRLATQKNPERAIEIMRLLREQKSDIKLVMVGDGDKCDGIKKSISRYGLQKNITMLGFLENPYPILDKTKILLITSDYEGTPMAILEAQALGKPVISTKIDGFEKLIFDDKNGFLSNDNDEIAAKIITFLREKNYKKLSDNTLNISKRSNDDINYFRTLIGIYKK